MTLMPDAPCSPASSRSLPPASEQPNICISRRRPPPHVESVIGELCRLERRLKVRPRWRLMSEGPGLGGQREVKGDVFELSPRADST